MITSFICEEPKRNISHLNVNCIFISYFINLYHWCLQAVGISVEFVSHMTRSFALSTKLTHVERAMEATANMGSAVSKLLSSLTVYILLEH